MAEDGQEDTIMAEAAEASPVPGDDSSEDSEGESSDSDSQPVLAVTRERRANAGNRMSKLLALAEEEDAQQAEEYGEIFAEAADDNEFEEQDEEEGDVNMDSSSEDEDAEAHQDEDAGEKEIRKQERADKGKKRKRESLLQDAMKRAAARVGPQAVPARTALSQPASPTAEAAPTRPKKKSERVSWLPESSDSGATRASSRHLAMQNKADVNARLKEKEKHRLRTVAIMKAAERRKEASRPKIMTQEERLAEAARTERLNSKSLNRWESAERKRMEEQRARLAALKDHRLEGPIISYYSGPSLWVGERLKGVGKEALVQEVSEKKTPTEERDEGKKPSTSAPAVQPMDVDKPNVPDMPIDLTSPPSPTSTPSVAAHTQPAAQLPAMVKQEPTDRFLEGIEAFATSTPEPHTHDAATPVTHDTPSVHSTPSASGPKQPDIIAYEVPPSPYYQASSPGGPTTAGELLKHYQKPSPFPPQPPEQAPAPPPPPAAAPIIPKQPPRREIASRILVVLRDFPPQEDRRESRRDADYLRHHLLGWPLHPRASSLLPGGAGGGGTTEKPIGARKQAAILAATKKTMTCAVTGQQAKYCDPATGLYYIDSTALKSMRWVVDSKGRWSELTGTFVGNAEVLPESKGRPAKGVPDWFGEVDREVLAKKREELRVIKEERDAKAKLEAEERAARVRASEEAARLQREQMDRYYRGHGIAAPNSGSAVAGAGVGQSRPPMPGQGHLPTSGLGVAQTPVPVQSPALPQPPSTPATSKP